MEELCIMVKDPSIEEFEHTTKLRNTLLYYIGEYGSTGSIETLKYFIQDGELENQLVAAISLLQVTDTSQEALQFLSPWMVSKPRVSKVYNYLCAIMKYGNLDQETKKRIVAFLRDRITTENIVLDSSIKYLPNKIRPIPVARNRKPFKHDFLHYQQYQESLR